MIHAGNFKDTYFVMDVESGSLHVVDRLAFEVAYRMEQGLDKTDIVSALSPSYSVQELEEVFDEMHALSQAGLLDAAAPPPSTPVFNHPVIKSLCLHIAHDCNLRCSYCFAAEGTYMGDRALMSEQVAKKALDFLMQQSKGRRHLEVDFFGGEPLINFGVVKKTVEYGRQLEKEFNKEIRFTLTTNAYHVTDEMADFINREMKNLVISIDGREHIHNAERKNAAGEGSYKKVVANAQKLIAGRGDKEYYIRGTYTANNLDFSEDVLAIAGLGFDQISVEPVVTKGPLALTQEHIPQIRREYEKLGELIEERSAAGKGFHFFHFMVDFTSGPCLNKRLRGCGAGTEYAAVTPSGDIYPCHQFVGKEGFKMGNVLEQTFDPSVGAPFMDCHVLNKPQCETCFAKYHCSGGCAAAAYNENGNIMKPHLVSCEIQRARMDTAIGLYIRKNFAV